LPNTGCTAADTQHVLLFTHLIKAVEMVLHALDGNVLAILDALCLQHLAECALALLGNEPVL
jgi:hypothetical protein